MRADLHVHTDISLGLRETIQVAKENGVTHMAITNHDTVRGLREAIKEGNSKGIIIVPGIEISAYDYINNRKVHILGFNFDLEGKNITKLCNPILERRNENSIWQIDRLKSNGYKINIQSILMRAKNSEIIYKQHIMAELIDKGYTGEIYSDLYKRLFKGGGICSRDIEYVDVFEAVKAIKADRGIAVLAHPGQLDSYSIIDRLVAQGLDGIELNHADHKEEDIKKVKEYSDKYSLILTGGSDFHGEYGSTVKIGEITAPNEYMHIFHRDVKAVKM
jgi:predicted metal-dependent phosphoesterase TrpH